MKRPIITLLTDFGTTDHYVAAMKGVILGICPQAELIDITHEITPYAIPEGAYTLRQAWQCFPKGTVHLAVVDPGVGSARRPIFAEVAGHRFVAPDNGLLSLVLEGHPRAKVREITATVLFRQPVSDTFHGRDIFAPVAARLASGIDPKRVGVVISGTIQGHFNKTIFRKDRGWTGVVLKIDRFGNVITNLEWDKFERIARVPFKMKLGRRHITHFSATYAAAPKNKIFALRGSGGYVEVSLNQSSAASVLGVTPGSKVELKVL